MKILIKMGLSRPVRLLFFLVVVSLVVPVGNECNAASETKKPVRIGLLSPEEGVLTFPEMRVGAETGVRYVNAELGGIDGRPIELVICTVGDTPESTVACAQELVNDDSIKMVINGSFNTSAGNSVLTKSGKPTLSFNQEPADMMTPGIYTTNPGALTVAATLFEFSQQGLGAKTFAMLVPDDPMYTGVIIPLALQVADIWGMKPSIKPLTIPAAADPTAAITIALGSNPEVLIVIADPALCVPTAKTLRALGANVPIVTSDTCMTPEALGQGDLDGWYGTSITEGPVEPTSRLDQSFTKIIEQYAKGDKRAATSFGSWALGNVIVASEVLKMAGIGAGSKKIVETLGTYQSKSVPGHPKIKCPGTDPFVGACASSIYVMQIEGSVARPAPGFVDIDLSRLKPLLGK